jgi:glycosyltransferase involved in cell wall biosynthesis
MERQLTELIHGLLEQGVEVTVVSRTCRLEPHLRLRWVRVPGPARPFVVAYPWFFVIGSLLTGRYRRGVLHTTGAIILNRAELSTVHYCHHATGARRLRRVSRRTLLHACNAWAARILSRAAEQIVYRPSRTAQLVGVSDDLTKDLAREFPKVSAQTIRNGVDSAKFRPDPDARAAVRRAHAIDEDELVAVFVGSEWVGKGLSLAVEAVQLVEGWRLLVVGDGDSVPYASVPEDVVLFVGLQEQPAPYYAAADAFVFPSAHEGDPLVVLEAAASGLPLLVGDFGGLDGLLVEGGNGWRLRRDPAVFAAKLQLLEDARLRHRLGAEARAAGARFSWTRVVDAYLSLYRELAWTHCERPALPSTRAK